MARKPVVRWLPASRISCDEPGRRRGAQLVGDEAEGERPGVGGLGVGGRACRRPRGTRCARRRPPGRRARRSFAASSSLPRTAAISASCVGRAVEVGGGDGPVVGDHGAPRWCPRGSPRPRATRRSASRCPRGSARAAPARRSARRGTRGARWRRAWRRSRPRPWPSPTDRRGPAVAGGAVEHPGDVDGGVAPAGGALDERPVRRRSVVAGMGLGHEVGDLAVGPLLGGEVAQPLAEKPLTS